MAIELDTRDPGYIVKATVDWNPAVNSINFLAETGFIPLPIDAAIPPMSDIAAAAISQVESSGTAPNPTWYVANFDDSTDEGLIWQTICPRGYGVTPTLRGWYYMAGANTNKNAVWVCRIAAWSSGDASVTAKVYAAVNTVTVAVPAVAGTLGTFTITLTDVDNLAAYDIMSVLLYRDGNDAADNAVGDAILMGAAIQFDM